MKHSGFTLLELAIVMTIIGLIAGGIVVGAKMIEAGENRSIMTDVEKYRAAIHTFKDKYGKVPGDLHNATRFWGKDNTLCPTHTGTAATDGTCNGNGNGSISTTDNPEPWYVWNHLSNAGMIEGKYDIYDHATSGDMVIGKYVPETAIAGASYAAADYRPSWINVIDWFYRGEYGHVFRFGVPNNPACPACFNEFERLSAARLWSIDDKIDDGKPGTGWVRTWKPGDSATVTPTTVHCADETDSTKPENANYRVNASRTRCNGIFLWGIRGEQ